MRAHLLLLMLCVGAMASGVRQLWNISSSSGICSTADFYDGLAFFGTNGGKLYAVDAKSGAVRWTYAGGTLNDSPLVAGTKVVIGDSTGPLRCFDAATGKLLWAFTQSQGFWGCKAAFGRVNGVDAVFIGGDSMNVYAVSLDNGTALWSTSIGAGADTSDALFYDASNFVIGDQNGVLTSLNANTGGVNWKVQVRSGAIYKGTLWNGKVFIGGACVSTDGKLLWKIADLTNSVGAPAVIGSTVVWPSNDGTVHASDVSGKVLWSVILGGQQLDGSATAYDGLALVGGHHGLYAIDPSTGKTSWSIQASGYASQLSSPAVRHGVVYFGTTLAEDSYMFAYSIGRATIAESICDDNHCSLNCRTGKVEIGCVRVSNSSSVDRVVVARTLSVRHYYESDVCGGGPYSDSTYAEGACSILPTGGSFRWSASS
jgi:outer membrane protein assembly factor BamB